MTPTSTDPLVSKTLTAIAEGFGPGVTAADRIAAVLILGYLNGTIEGAQLTWIATIFKAGSEDPKKS